MAEKPPKVGELIDGPEARDAIHIAVAPVTADEALKPGQPIKFSRNNDNNFVVGADWADSVGIVDPYLKANVPEEAKFWMFVKPNTITSLKHNWTHPSFSNEDVRSKAEGWIRMYAVSLGVDYKELMKGAFDYIETGYSFSDGPTLESVSTSENFWVNFEVLTGIKRPDDRDKDFFSCAC